MASLGDFLRQQKKKAEETKSLVKKILKPSTVSKLSSEGQVSYFQSQPIRGEVPSQPFYSPEKDVWTQEAKSTNLAVLEKLKEPIKKVTQPIKSSLSSVLDSLKSSAEKEKARVEEAKKEQAKQPKLQMFETSQQAGEQFRALSPAEKWKDIGKYAGEIGQGIARAGVKFGYSAIPEVQNIIRTGEPSEGLPVGKIGQVLLGTDKITSYQKDIIHNLALIRGENPEEPYYESLAKASATPVLNMLFDAWITSGIMKAGAKGLEKLLPSKEQVNNWAAAGYPTTKAEGIKNIKDKLQTYHPDVASRYGISPEVARTQSAKLNQALNYFNKAKNPIPNQNIVKNVLGRFGQVLLEQPSQLNELLTQPLIRGGEPVPLARRLLPEKIGMTPVQPYQPTPKAVPFGLSTKEVPISPEKPIPNIEIIPSKLPISALPQGLDFWAYKLMGATVDKPIPYTDISKTLSTLEKGNLPKGTSGLKKEDIPLYLDKVKQIQQEFLRVFPEAGKVPVAEVKPEAQPEVSIPKELEPTIQWLREEVKIQGIKNAKDFVTAIENNKIVIPYKEGLQITQWGGNRELYKNGTTKDVYIDFYNQFLKGVKPEVKPTPTIAPEAQKGVVEGILPQLGIKPQISALPEPIRNLLRAGEPTPTPAIPMPGEVPSEPIAMPPTGGMPPIIPPTPPVPPTASIPNVPPPTGEVPLSQLPDEQFLAKINEHIDKARRMNVKQIQIYTKELKKRLARALESEKTVVEMTGSKEEGLKAFYGALKGEYPKVPGGESLRQLTSQENVDRMMDLIGKSPEFTGKPFDAHNAQRAFMDLIDGNYLTPSRLDLLEKALSPATVDNYLRVVDVLRELRQAEKPVALLTKIWDNGVELLSTPKSLMTHGDLSQIFLQGYIAASLPTIWLPDVGKSILDVLSSSHFETGWKAIRENPLYPLAVKANVSFTNPALGLSYREEAFASRIPELIPIYKHIYLASERGYYGLLNRLRMDIFTFLVEKFYDAGGSLDEHRLWAIGDLTNAMTGRGNLGQTLNRISPTINIVFFGPRLQASILAPLYSYPRYPSDIRKYAYGKTIFGGAGVMATLASIIALIGYLTGEKVELELDPIATKFGKITVGKTDIDITGKRGRFIRDLARIVTGKMKTTEGDILALGKGSYAVTREDIIYDLIKSKFSPALGFGVMALKGTDYRDQPINWLNEVLSLLTPISYQHYAGSRQQYDVPGSLLATVPNFIGLPSYTEEPDILRDITGIVRETGEVPPEDIIQWLYQQGYTAEQIRIAIGEGLRARALEEQTEIQGISLGDIQYFKSLSARDQINFIKNLSSDAERDMYMPYRKKDFDKILDSMKKKEEAEQGSVIKQLFPDIYQLIKK